MVSVIASTGQTSIHSPHPTHRGARTTRVPPEGRIACSGQVSRHAPQPWQAPIATMPGRGGGVGARAATGTPSG